MQDRNLLEEELQELIVDLCEILYQRGYRAVPIGAIMRLIGVNDEKAVEHDRELFQLDSEFEHLVQTKHTRRKSLAATVPPLGTTLH